MSKQTQLQLSELVAEREEGAVLEMLQQRIDDNDNLLEIIDECNHGMCKVGSRYEKGEYFIAGLFMAGHPRDL